MLIQLVNTKHDLTRLSNYLEEVDQDFEIPLSKKIIISDYASKLLKWGNVICIIENGSIVAVIAFYCNDTINKIAILPLLTTKKIVRGKGYAKVLIKEMILICKKHKIEKICCDSVNPAAIKLYKSIGFNEYQAEKIGKLNKTYLEYYITEKKMKFLITAIGSFSADCVIQSLKNTGNSIIGCDIYNKSWHAISKDCDTFYQAPNATEEEEYVEFLIDIIKKEKINFLIPLTDLEIDVINRHRHAFSESSALLCIQSEQCLQIARNKYNLCKYFQGDKFVNIPSTLHSKDLSHKKNLPLSFPLIAKPVNGRSSEGLYRLLSKEELVPFYKYNNYIIQEMIEGSVYTVDYVRDCTGNDFSIPREELLRTKNGAGTTVRIFTDKVLQDTVSYIGNQLKIIGCVNMEFIFNNGKYYLIDINPRFSAGIAFSKITGYNMVTSHINCFIGKEILPPIEYKNQIVTKKYVEETTWIEQ